jgi:hypothetical protein
MMDGICRVVGSGIPVTLAGATYLLSPLTLSDIGTIEQLLLSRRPLPIDTAYRMASVIKDRDLQSHVLELAQKDMRRRKSLNKVAWSVIADWIDGDEGTEVTAWLCLQRHHPIRFETQEQVREVLALCKADELERFRKLRDQVSGLHWFSAIDWPKSRATESSGEGGKGPPEKGNWRQWIRRVMDAYPGLNPIHVREWTIDMAKAVLAETERDRKRRQRRERASASEDAAAWGGDSGGEVTEGQLRKAKVI